jgi:hypothetical protein
MTVTFSIDPTPNPNSMKITVSTVLSSGVPITYPSAAEAEKDEFVKTLFAVPGVRSIFVIHNFATVTKDPNSDWQSILPKLQEAVQNHFQGK